jgi:N-acetylneuraminate synthase
LPGHETPESTLSAEITINGRTISPRHPPYVIAEMSGNHNGDIDRALRLIDAAVEAGADAVKLQTYTADTITLDHDGPGFRIEGGLWAGRTLYELYQEAHTPWDWHPALFEHARRRGIAIFSSPFDASAIELLERLGAPAYKIASFELVDLPLVARAARTGKPLIMSTGLATIGEIEEAVDCARRAGAREILLLHCTSGYPTPASDSNLRTIPHLAATFGVPVGLSDHTHGISVPVAAVALGAVAVEKHFTLARADGGPDAAFSLEADELKAMVAACRTGWEALGAVDYSLAPSEGKGRTLRRSLYAVADIGAGERFSAANIRSIRPGLGLHTRHYEEILGRRTTRPIKRGEPLQWSMVEAPS